jgi:hypothetical protein
MGDPKGVCAQPDTLPQRQNVRGINLRRVGDTARSRESPEPGSGHDGQRCPQTCIRQSRQGRRRAPAPGVPALGRS